MISLSIGFLWIESISTFIKLFNFDETKLELTKDIHPPIHYLIQMCVELPFIGFLAYHNYFWLPIVYIAGLNANQYMRKEIYKKYLQSQNDELDYSHKGMIPKQTPNQNQYEPN